jgi:hypothetical protein
VVHTLAEICRAGGVKAEQQEHFHLPGQKFISTRTQCVGKPAVMRGFSEGKDMVMMLRGPIATYSLVIGRSQSQGSSVSVVTRVPTGRPGFYSRYG